MQTISFILPISESAHSAIYHDFSKDFSGTYSNLSGVIHIGIAVGIILSMYNYFFKFSKEFVSTGVDIAKKQLKGKETSPARQMMYMTLISLAPMILLAIPVGNGKVLYNLLKTTQYNKTLLDDGIFLLILGALLIFAIDKLSKKKDNKNISLLPALVIGFLNILFVPVSGLAIIGGTFAVLTIFGVSRKIAYRYGFVTSAPLLIIMGIVECFTSNIRFKALPLIIAFILATVVAFFMVRLFKFIIKKNYLKYFGFYDVALGGIIAIVGVFQLIFR